MQRKTASKIFTKKTFTGHFYDTLQEKLATLFDLIEAHRQKNLALPEAERTPMPMQENFSNLALDSFVELAVGVNLKSLTAEDEVPLATAMETFQRCMLKRMLNPLWRELKYVLKSERDITRCIKTLNDFYDGLIKQTKQASDLKSRQDILSLFLKTKDDEMDETLLREILLSLMIAGRDTTASSLTFTFLMLGTHPEVQAAAFEEISRVLNESNEKKVTVDMLANLPYLHGVIMEVLRIYPPIVFTAKKAVEDDLLPGGHPIPAGTIITTDI